MLALTADFDSFRRYFDDKSGALSVEAQPLFFSSELHKYGSP
jgi:hypothetical protein